MKTKRRKSVSKRVLLILLAVFAVFVASVLLIATHRWKDPVKQFETTNPFITETGKPMVSAHRSGAGIFPENTMMAFENCIESDVFKTDIFEFDLHITKDKELILLHDDTLDRTTNSEAVFGVKKARPENYTLAELKTLNFGEGFETDSGEHPYRGLTGDAVPDSLRVATLNEVLTYLQGNGDFQYIIEIKNKKTLGYEAADRLYAILKEHNLLQKVIVGTFNGEVTAYLDENYPDLIRSASIKEVILFYLDSLINRERPADYYKFDALQIPANQYVIQLGNSRLVNYAHKNNIAVQYWTINKEKDIRLLRDIGADCIMSDLPDLAYRVINE